MQDWLFLAYHRVRGVEYGLLVATFVAIMVLGLELGIAAGIVAASLLFAYNYSKVPWTKRAQSAAYITPCITKQGSHAYWMAPCVLSMSAAYWCQLSICCTAVLYVLAVFCKLYSPAIALSSLDVQGLISYNQGV
jgi:uncharacterized membrane protein